MAAALRQLLIGERERRPHFGVWLHRIPESRRRDPDDLVRPSVHAQRPLDEGSVGRKSALPETVAHDDHRLLALLLFVQGKRSAEERLHAEQLEEARRDELAENAFRRVADQNGEASALYRGNVAERALMTADIAEFGRGRPILVFRHADASKPLPHHHETLGVRVGQRFENHSIQDAENRRVGADAQRQRDDDDQAEDGVLEDEPETCT